MSDTHSNGHLPKQEEQPAPSNPYADALAGKRPRELVEFDLHTDPYANMLPRVASISSLEEDEEEEHSGEKRRRNPILVAVSLLLIVILVLPIMVEVFARLTH